MTKMAKTKVIKLNLFYRPLIFHRSIRAHFRHRFEPRDKRTQCIFLCTWFGTFFHRKRLMPKQMFVFSEFHIYCCQQWKEREKIMHIYDEIKSMFDLAASSEFLINRRSFQFQFPCLFRRTKQSEMKWNVFDLLSRWLVDKMCLKILRRFEFYISFCIGFASSLKFNEEKVILSRSK